MGAGAAPARGRGADRARPPAALAVIWLRTCSCPQVPAAAKCHEPALMLVCCRCTIALLRSMLVTETVLPESGAGAARQRADPAPTAARARARARALDDLLGAAVAGAGGARDRGRPVPRGVLARAVAVAAAARRAPSALFACGAVARRRGCFRFCVLRFPGAARWPAPARPQQRPAPSAGDRDRRRSRRHPERPVLGGAVARPCRARACRRAQLKAGRPSPRLACAIRLRCARWC